MPRIIVFGDKTFRTQKSAESYVKELIYGIGICESVKTLNHAIFEEVLNVLKRHPQQSEKLSNMKDLKIVRNALNIKALEIYVIKNDGTYEDISWRTCISGKGKTDKQELLSAMRYSIEDQIKEFKTNMPSTECSLCGQHNFMIHVDHIIHFEKLTQDFLCETILEVPTVYDEATDGSNRRKFKNEHIDFENEWTTYHRRNAKLRILCATCNLTRTKFKCKRL